jgi:hypothetical protein
MLNVMERMVAVPPKQLREQISRFVEATWRDWESRSRSHPRSLLNWFCDTAMSVVPLADGTATSSVNDWMNRRFKKLGDDAANPNVKKPS